MAQRKVRMWDHGVKKSWPMLLRSARYFPGVAGKWIPLPPMYHTNTRFNNRKNGGEGQRQYMGTLYSILAVSTQIFCIPKAVPNIYLLKI